MGFLYKKFLGGEESELEDVIRNLGYLFGTKRGSGSFLRDFGLSETGYRTPEEMIEGVSHEIRESIKRYEPRVNVVEIEEIEGERGSRLAIHCTLKGSDQKLKI